jgi:hypothetical protein
VSGAGALKVDGSAVTQPVSGTITANAGTGTFTTNISQYGGVAVGAGNAVHVQPGTGATFTVLQATASNLNATVVGTGTDNTTNSTSKLPVLAARANTAAPTWSDGNMVPLSVDTTGALRITGSISASNPSVSTTGTAVPASATYIGGTDGTNLRGATVFDADTGGGTQYVMGVVLRQSASGGSVELGTTTNPVVVEDVPSSTSSVTSVAASATNVTLLASNTNRVMATIFNDGNAQLYVKLGTTASTTSFTVKIAANGYYELPYKYTGQIDGIWSAANGSARITELT